MEAARPDLSQLGRYRVEALIGRGAMGAVYRGIDPSNGRTIALKTLALAREFDGEALTEARARFARESDTAARLHHPGIVAVYEAGEDQGLAFIAMEYVLGASLAEYTVASRLMPPAQVAAVGALVADALDHAHRQGVVHRDIKPANVLVDLASATVKVADFGIARITDAARTRTGLMLGTPSFMAPEQMAGGRIDGRSDLYSLGVMLFQLLTGVLPHASESMARLMFAIANEPAPDLRSLRPELPETLARVVAHALEKRPDRRPADAGQMAADLRAVNC
jgi:eukaryotic-like serine/threonine-protein kinase